MENNKGNRTDAMLHELDLKWMLCLTLVVCESCLDSGFGPKQPSACTWHATPEWEKVVGVLQKMAEVKTYYFTHTLYITTLYNIYPQHIIFTRRDGVMAIASVLWTNGSGFDTTVIRKQKIVFREWKPWWKGTPSKSSRFFWTKFWALFHFIAHFDTQHQPHTYFKLEKCVFPYFLRNDFCLYMWHCDTKGT